MTVDNTGEPLYRSPRAYFAGRVLRTSRLAHEGVADPPARGHQLPLHGGEVLSDTP